MNRKKLLLEKLNDLNKECKILVSEIKNLDRIQGLNWYIFVFLMIPLLLLMLAHTFFELTIFGFMRDYSFMLFTLILLQSAFLQYIRQKCSQQYEKLFSKQKMARSVCFVLNKPYHPEF